MTIARPSCHSTKVRVCVSGQVFKGPGFFSCRVIISHTCQSAEGSELANSKSCTRRIISITWVGSGVTRAQRSVRAEEIRRLMKIQAKNADSFPAFDCEICVASSQIVSSESRRKKASEASRPGPERRGPAISSPTRKDRVRPGPYQRHSSLRAESSPTRLLGSARSRRTAADRDRPRRPDANSRDGSPRAAVRVSLSARPGPERTAADRGPAAAPGR